MNKHISYLSSALLLLALSCIFAGPLQAQAYSSVQSTRAWHLVPSPNSPLADNALLSVAALSANDTWAVGGGGSYSQPGQSLIEHWNGKAWSIAPSPTVLGSILYAVTPIPHSKQLWAVGHYTDNSNSYQTLAERWNGKAWNVLPTPLFKTSPRNNTNTLYGVSALSTNDAWAAGAYDNGSGSIQAALLEHWNGTQWTAMAAPTPAGTLRSLLFSVTALSTKDVWAVGTAILANSEVALIEHWNGSTWTFVKAPNPGTIANFLYSVTPIAGTNQLWAVGNFLNKGSIVEQTLIERWNGKQWLVVASPSPGVNANTLQSVTATAPNDGWAVGSEGNSNGALPLIEHWNGTTWTLVSSPAPSQSVLLRAVTSIPGTYHLWAVGYYFGTASDQFTLTEAYS